MSDVQLHGVIGGLSVKPNKDGGLDGSISLHFSVEEGEPEALSQLMRSPVNVDISRAQAVMFGAPAADPTTGEIADEPF